MYVLEWIKSPNFTPASQARAVYGKPRTIEFGAGHWWGDPNAGYSHQGVVNTFLNPKRQASAHAVISEGRVTEMVRKEDISWATNSANPFTFSIELKPNMTEGDKRTCAEYIADKGLHDLKWLPHNHWKATQCNPLPWGEIMEMAKRIWHEKNNPSPILGVNLSWEKLPKPLEVVTTLQPTTLWKIDVSAWDQFQVVKQFNKGERLVVVGKVTNQALGSVYYVTEYSFNKRIPHGFNARDLEIYSEPKAPEIPEWQKNLVDISPVKLMALWPDVAVYNMNSQEVITTIPKGTVVDFVKKTKVGEIEYLVSSYSASNSMPNGILASRMGVPLEPPKNEKPEWLRQWEDIEDKDMYTRGAAQVVDLLEGATVKTLEPNTKVRVLSATWWHGQQYFIVSQGGSGPEGIAVVSLDEDPTPDPQNPILPSPSQPNLVKVNWIWRVIMFLLRIK